MGADLDPMYRPPAHHEPAVRRKCRRLLKRMREVSYDHGYNLIAHGSMKRDLDVVALPWEEAARPREQLVEALCAAISARVSREPEVQPHHRVGYILTLTRGGVSTTAGLFPYIDLCVVERSIP